MPTKMFVADVDGRHPRACRRGAARGSRSWKFESKISTCAPNSASAADPDPGALALEHRVVVELDAIAELDLRVRVGDLDVAVAGVEQRRAAPAELDAARRARSPRRPRTAPAAPRSACPSRAGRSTAPGTSRSAAAGRAPRPPGGRSGGPIAWRVPWPRPVRRAPRRWPARPRAPGGTAARRFRDWSARDLRPRRAPARRRAAAGLRVRWSRPASRERERPGSRPTSTESPSLPGRCSYDDGPDAESPDARRTAPGARPCGRRRLVCVRTRGTRSRRARGSHPAREAGDPRAGVRRPRRAARRSSWSPATTGRSAEASSARW